MSKLLPWGGLVASLGACLAMLLPVDDGTQNSFLCSLAVMLHAAIVIFPLLAGVASIDATFMNRGRSRFLLEALPSSARLRAASGRVGWISLAGCAGILLACVVAGTLAVSNGSRFSWGVWPFLLLACVGIVSATCIGWAIGAIAKSWFIPPLIIIVTYGGAAANISYVQLPSAALSALWTPTPALLHFPLPLIGWTLGLHVLLALVGVTGWLVWCQLTKQRILLLVTALFLTIGCAASMVNGWLGISGAVVANDTSDWICAPLASGAQVCLPPERPQDLPDLVIQLESVNTRALQLDPGLASRTWRGIDSPAGTSLVYELPLGQSPTLSQHAGAAAASLFIGCVLDALDKEDEDLLDMYAEAQVIVATWLDPEANGKFIDIEGNVYFITFADAQDAYRKSIQC
ncbi:MAG: hypothetical protein FWD55_02985 [Propionibacteriaceae bacterium]|nr:hypothetical protein [Propionibacteriaceae bacterium]